MAIGFVQNATTMNKKIIKRIILNVIIFFRRLFRKNASVSSPEFIPLKRKLSFQEHKALKKSMNIKRFQEPCKYCGQPMFVSVGQIAYFHRACRTKGRNQNALRYL